MDFTKNPKAPFKPVGRLSKKEAAREIDALREGIRYHDHLYYVKNKPRFADAAYDRLFKRLQDLEAAFPDQQTRDSPTTRVGAEPQHSLKKARHAIRMLSLEAAHSQDGLRAFDATVRHAAGRKDVAYALEPKFDGMSVEIVYRRGHFERGTTRGNGEVGEDISHNLKTVAAVPLVLRNPQATPARLAVRGEIFLRRKGFLALNRACVERGEDAFANARNAAAGLMRQLDPAKVAGLPFDVFFYEILDISGKCPATHRETFDNFSDWGLKICPENGRASSVPGVKRYHATLARRRDQLDYEIDGTVVKIDAHALREKLGVRARSPRWAIAWKFEPRAQITSVEDIVVQVGRTGVLTPVALLRSVVVGGVTVGRATLHNENEIRRKDIRIGDGVRVIRAGDVIPEIEKRIKRSGKKRGKPFSMPDRCPACGAAVARDGAYHLCTAGLSCPAQLAARIQHYASRNALDIEHLGEDTAKQLVERRMVNDLADIYLLSAKHLEALDGFAPHSAKRLHNAIKAKKSPRLDRFLYALGIRHIGRRSAQLLADEFGSLAAVEDAKAERIAAIKGLGDEAATAFRQFFAQAENRHALERMKHAGVRIVDMPERGRAPLRDKTFTLTGSLERYTRAEAKERIESLGGRTTSSVSTRTDYLVVGRNPGSKLDQARVQRAKILNEDQFGSMIEVD